MDKNEFWFEDISILNEMIESMVTIGKRFFSEYQNLVMRCGQNFLINFFEMSSKTADENFLLQKKIEKWFSDKYPENGFHYTAKE
jgi:kynurenine 3-monooxygenase